MYDHISYGLAESKAPHGLNSPYIVTLHHMFCSEFSATLESNMYKYAKRDFPPQ